MESRGPEGSKNVKTSQAYFFEGFISFFEDFSLTIYKLIYFIIFFIFCVFITVFTYRNVACEKC